MNRRKIFFPIKVLKNKYQPPAMKAVENTRKNQI